MMYLDFMNGSFLRLPEMYDMWTWAWLVVRPAASEVLGCSRAVYVLPEPER
jgi:hypothetical protein